MPKKKKPAKWGELVKDWEIGASITVKSTKEAQEICQTMRYRGKQGVYRRISLESPLCRVWREL